MKNFRNILAEIRAAMEAEIIGQLEYTGYEAYNKAVNDSADFDGDSMRYDTNPRLSFSCKVLGFEIHYEANVSVNRYEEITIEDMEFCDDLYFKLDPTHGKIFI